MTLLIAALTSSGIILSSDSRQTYRNNAGFYRVGSDSARKLFKLSDKCAVAVSGRAFLNEDGQPLKDVGYYISKFRNSNDLSVMSIEDIALKLNVYLGSLFVEQERIARRASITQEISEGGGTNIEFQHTEDNLVPYTYRDSAGVQQSQLGWFDTIEFIIAGTDSDDICRAYLISVPKGITAVQDNQNCGAMWAGQTDVLRRIIKGFAPEIGNLEFVQTAFSDLNVNALGQLNRLEYVINWGTITLQDAVDFCILMTRTTENIQRFSDGTFMSPGGVTGVGGEIDVVVITPENGFTWLRNKKLTAEGAELSLMED